MGWTGLGSDENDGAMDLMLDLREAVDKELGDEHQAMIERKLLQMVEEAYHLSDFWGLLVATRKA